MSQDISAALQAQVLHATANHQPLAIIGGGSKHKAQPGHTRLDISTHMGIVDYEPSELFITARAGTSMDVIETVLDERGQMLACEPPHLDGSNGRATWGGTLACGYSGPRRPFGGSVRDHVLGLRLLDGEGHILQFGGHVMKNVAGFDVSRLMVGARGTLGVILEATLKVMPRPECEETLVWPCSFSDAPRCMSELRRRSMPLSALTWCDDLLLLRLEGTTAGLRAARAGIGGEVLPEGPSYWQSLREHTHAFFRRSEPLWRLSLPAASQLNLPPDDVLMEWGGSQRWWFTNRPAAEVEALALQYGGFAYLFNASQPIPAPVNPALKLIYQRLKATFDPNHIFNPGMMPGMH
jgi:glycolate oxidase FAD binding subunit